MSTYDMPPGKQLRIENPVNIKKVGAEFCFDQNIIRNKMYVISIFSTYNVKTLYYN